MRRLVVPSGFAQNVRIIGEVQPDEITEYLGGDELAIVEKFKFQRQREEWIASRIAAKQLAVERGHVRQPRDCRFPKRGDRPAIAIDDEPHREHVSFSHSAGFGAAAMGPSPIGLDLQELRPIDPRTRKFFLTDEELRVADQLPVDNPLLHWWCAKEAAYKIDDKTSLKAIPLVLREQLGARTFEFETYAGVRVQTMIVEGFLLAVTV